LNQRNSGNCHDRNSISRPRWTRRKDRSHTGAKWLYAQDFAAFGAERRGAPVISFTRLGEMSQEVNLQIALFVQTNNDFFPLLRTNGSNFSVIENVLSKPIVISAGQCRLIYGTLAALELLKFR
jgi:hypothetical protein